MCNQEIIRLLKKEKIYQWEIAKAIGVHETTLCRWFREELTQEQIQPIVLAVEEIKLNRVKKK